MGSGVRYQFTLLRMDLFNNVVKFLEEACVLELFGADARQDFTRKPAALVIGVDDFEVAAFDLDDQPHFLRKLELVPIVLRPAINEVADLNWTGFHTFVTVWTAQTNSGIDARSIWAFGPQAAQSGRRGMLNERNVISSASYDSNRPFKGFPIPSSSLMTSVAWIRPMVPGNTPSTPASSQLGASSGGAASAQTQRKHGPS